MFLDTRGKAYAPPRKPANPLTTVFTTMLPTGKFYLALLVSVSKLFPITERNHRGSEHQCCWFSADLDRNRVRKGCALEAVARH